MHLGLCQEINSQFHRDEYYTMPFFNKTYKKAKWLLQTFSLILAVLLDPQCVIK